MVVVAIIGLLAAVAVPAMLSAKRTANDSSALGTLRSIANAIEMFAVVNARYPDDMDDLFDGDYIDEAAVPVNCYLVPAVERESVFAHYFYYIFHAPDSPLGPFRLIAHPVNGKVARYRYTISAGGSLQESLIY